MVIMTRFVPQVIIRRSRPSVVALLSNGNHQSRLVQTRTRKPGARLSSNPSGGIERPGCQAKIRLRVEAAALAILIYIRGSHLPSSINGHVQYLVCAREPPSPNSTPALWFLTRCWWELPSRVRDGWSKHPLACPSLRRMCCLSFLIRSRPRSGYTVVLRAFFNLLRSASLCAR